jgi:hypothetical protein
MGVEMSVLIEQLRCGNWAKQVDAAYVAALKIEELEAELLGTVTTDYHDSIVAEAMQRVSDLETEVKHFKSQCSRLTE